MSARARSLPEWFAYADLACAAAAGALWYAFPGAGPWPLLLGLAPWAVRLARTGRLTRRTSFDLPLLLFLLTAGASVWAAYDRETAWAKFWLIVGGVLLFYALVNAGALGAERAWLLGFFGAGVALYFLATHDWDAYPAKIEALTRLGRALQAPLPRLPGHRLHPNVAGGIMATMWPFAGWTALQAWREERPGRWLPLAVSLGAVTLTSFGLLMTTSRGAWIALGGALGLAALWALAGRLSRDRPARQRWLFVGLAGAVLGAALVLALTWPGGVGALVEAVPGPNTGASRLELLQRTLTLARDYPFVGAGLGAFQMLYSTYVLLLHVGFSVHSHNLFLNVAVEQGLPALLLLAWMGLQFAAGLWRDTRTGRGALGAAALALVVVLIHGMVDDVLYGSRAVLLLFVPLAFAAPLAGQRARMRGRVAAWVVPLGVVLLLILALLWRDPLLAAVYANLGAVHQSRAELSVYEWPEWPIQDAVRRQVNLGRPIAEFERALALDAGNATANRRLGMIELALGEYEDALRHLDAAYDAAPGDATTRQLLGEALIVNGYRAEGEALWAGVNNAQNQLDLRVFWYQHIGEEERAAWLLEATESR